MNPQYGGPAFQQFGAPAPHGAPYRQLTLPESYNGFESQGHTPSAPTTNKNAANLLFSSGTSSQNGPAARPSNPTNVGIPLSSQSFQHPAHPSPVPPPLSTSSGVAADQIAQRVNDMHLYQDRSHPLYSSSPGIMPPQRQVRPNSASFPPQRPGFSGPTYPPVSSYNNAPVSQYGGHPLPQISGSVAPQSHFSSGDISPASLVRPPSNSSTAIFNSADIGMMSGSHPPMPNSNSCSSQQAVPHSSEILTNSSLNQVPHSMASGTFSDPSQPPPTLMGQPPPISSHANGPLSSPSVGQYAPPQQHPPPMQARYPPASQLQNNVQGAGPQSAYPQQYSQVGQPMNRYQDRITPSLSQQNAAQARRLDPDHMPSPIQVIEDDRKARKGPFCTNTRGQVPPLITTKHTVVDEGICNPRFIRSTVYSVPTTADMLKQTAVPFSLVISPFACLPDDENPPPLSVDTDCGPVRCNRCKAYMCPFMQFIDGGRRFQCVFCKGMTDVPAGYFAHLDHMGQRTDKFQRPELCLGSYEYIGTKDYCKNGMFPNKPAFIFMIDVSYNSIRNGMVKLLCENMKHILSVLPREVKEKPSNIRVGFVTYSNVVHFYNIKGNLAQPQMLVVSDVQDMFMPLLDGFLVNISEAEHVVDSLMEQIPIMFADTRETETILGPAIQAGLEALKAADCSGKLFVFHSTLPIAEAPGKLKNRDDRKLLGTEKEKTILTPQNSFYNNLGQECVSGGCCVDLFLFPNAYIDIATLGQVCRLTGGQIYKYTFFQADIDGLRFLEDLKRNVSKPIAFDAIMRVRTSTGIRPTDFYGNYFMSNTTDVELASIDCDKAIVVEIKYDDKLVEEDGAFIQAAVLFTNCDGQRKLRIHNLALNTCSLMAELFRNCELDTIMNVFLKEAVRMISEQTPRQVKDHFVSRSAQVLACYRKNCANPSSAGQLILPECMKLLPLYINCLIKCDAIAGGQEISTDDRSFVMLVTNSMDVNSSACYLYPRLLPLHDANTNSSELPSAMRSSVEKIKDYGVYLVENGILMFLWIGLAVSPEWLGEVFGVQSAARIDIDKTTLLELNTPLSKRVRGIIKEVQKERQRHMKLIIVRQGDKLEFLFRQLLVEDRTSESSASYVDFLCHLHKEIRSLLT